jgi:hypothetical protein
MQKYHGNYAALNKDHLDIAKWRGGHNAKRRDFAAKHKVHVSSSPFWKQFERFVISWFAIEFVWYLICLED